jgi:hypothetical protein
LRFVAGVEKSILHTSAHSTLLKDGGNQEHGNDVEENCFFICVLASARNKAAAT